MYIPPYSFCVEKTGEIAGRARLFRTIDYCRRFQTKHAAVRGEREVVNTRIINIRIFVLSIIIYTLLYIFSSVTPSTKYNIKRATKGLMIREKRNDGADIITITGSCFLLFFFLHFAF